MKHKILVLSLSVVILGALSLGVSWPVSTWSADPSFTINPVTTGGNYVYVRKGQTTEVSWQGVNIPSSMKCDVNYNSADTTGLEGLQDIHTKLFGRNFASKGYVTVPPNYTGTGFRTLKFTCFYTSNPSQIIIEQDLKLGISSGVAISPTVTITAEPATGLRLNDNTKISWTMTNLPAGGTICQVDRTAPDVIAGLTPYDLDLVDKGLGRGIAGQYVYGDFSGYANVKITNLNPTTKYLRAKCDLPTGYADINTQTEIKTTTAAPALPAPFVYVNVEPKTDLDLTHAFTVSWETNNLPLNYKCWMNDGGTGINLLGANNSLANGPTSYIDYNGAHYGGAFKGSNSSARLISASPVSKIIKFACGPTFNSEVGAVTSSVSVTTSAPEPTAVLTPIDPTTSLKVGDTVRVTYNASHIPSTMRCVTNYAGGLATGVSGVKEISDQLAGKTGTFSGNGNLGITPTVIPPADKKIRLICYYTADPDNFIIDSQLPLKIVPGPAAPTPSLVLSPTSDKLTGTKPGDRINFTWNINNLPAKVDGVNITCWNNAGYDPSKDINGWAEVKTRLYNNKKLSGSATLTVGYGASGQKRLRVMCGKYPNDWSKGLVVDKVLVFNISTPSAPNFNRVYGVMIDGMDINATSETSLWGLGLTKTVKFNYAGFQKTCKGDFVDCNEAQKLDVKKAIISFRHPNTGKKKALYNKTVGLGSGSSFFSVTINADTLEKIDKKDPAVAPYYDGYKTTLEICPAFADNTMPMTRTCATSQIFTVSDPNDAHSPTYNLPAGQGCITGSCVCVNGVRKRCGSPMQSGSSCPLNHSNYPAGVCSGVGSASEKMMATAQTAFKGTMDLIVKLFGY